MKLKHARVRVAFIILFGLISFCMFAGGANSAPRGALYVALCYVFGVIFLAMAVLSFVIPSIMDKKEIASIERVQIVDVSAKASAGSAIARGIVGDAIAGSAGAIIGASTAKQNKTTTFVITYKSGKTKKKVVPNDAPNYNRYVKLVK